MILQMISDSAPAGAYSNQPITIPQNEQTITRPEDVISFFGDFFKRKKQEYFCALNLNGAGKIISARIITIGLLNHSLVHPRETFRDAIIDGAATIIVVHNHPSGSLEPSSQDIAVTNQLKESGDILGIRVLDHIIIGSAGGYCSLKERGLI